MKMDIIEEGVRFAKKEHTCSFCGGKINTGEQYEYQKISNHGDFYTWKSHLRCKFLVNYFDMMSHCNMEDGLTSDDFSEQLREILWFDFPLYELAEIVYNRVKKNNGTD